jgi:3-methylcrotonyl-CoA carboxylase alpha subunit
LFTKILVANRGEIACRVITTAKRLGIKTVAVYSDTDRHSRHVNMADEAFRIGPAAARESYLRGDIILQIAAQTGAQAIHPGYGFLSENDEFARQCSAAGLVFIGPPADAIAAMGSKSAAKSAMQKAGVPLVPGYHGANQDPAFLHDQARNMGYPVLIKASAGGGGKGMRIVNSDSAFLDALAGCQREAAASFGETQVLLERYLLKPRHIEIQVFADNHGNCLYLHERDCSVQRRHQKVLEEAPAPGMTPARRAQMGQAAVAAARAVGYRGAGTVEFIVQPDGEFFFMEMNTRLQVEHPVTEAITGLDLVHWQLLVAAGQPLPLKQEQVAMRGHAIEARIYAENPAKQFLPAIGPMTHLRLAPGIHFQAQLLGADEPAAVRVDSGVLEGGQISPYYDPMIAKLIVWGHDRQQALQRMHAALQQCEVAPLVTNIGFLQSLVQSASFVRADLDTGLIEREREFLFQNNIHDIAQLLTKAIAAQLLSETAAAQTSDPWSVTNGWRHLSYATRNLTLILDGTTYNALVQYAARGYSITVEGFDSVHCLADLAHSATTITGTLGSTPFSQTIVAYENSWIVFERGIAHHVTVVPTLDYVKQGATQEGSVTAPMPGKIVAILVKPNDVVIPGQPLLILEAMKMEHTIACPGHAVVQSLPYAVGDQVAEGVRLIELAKQEGR